ncbi:hypothetical protein LCGC14_0599590 [marine sediment metagenome]|uniref:HNH nuclease domain-containing protein n=1 Tax=marine sediment metagenome TaxID=412755 RepID=A0A0F9RFQ2_9ZZZZ
MDRLYKFHPGHELPEIFCFKTMKRLLLGLKLNKETGCWEWQKCKDDRGYGKMWYNGKSHWVHRLAYALFKGEIPETITVDHSCRVRACCNPYHLELMTVSENSKQRWKTCKQ